MTIGLLYVGLFGLGVVYALLASFFGWISDHDFGGLHGDAGDAGGVDGQPHPISGTVVATFITGFGAGGTLAHYLLHWQLVPGLLTAGVSGLLLAGAAFLALELLFSRTQAGSEFAMGDAAGREAEVITSIPAAGIGEITFLVKGQRARMAARSSDGAAIAKGRPVVIERISGSTAHVRAHGS